MHKEIENILYKALQHGLNRSITALEEAGAIDTTTLREQYTGVGSRFYDLVTQQIEHTVNQTLPELIDAIDHPSDK